MLLSSVSAECVADASPARGLTVWLEHDVWPVKLCTAVPFCVETVPKCQLGGQSADAAGDGRVERWYVEGEEPSRTVRLTSVGTACPRQC